MNFKDVVETVTGYRDPQIARQAMLEKVQHTREAFQNPENAHADDSWIKRDAGHVAFGPTRPDGQQLVIGGQATSFWNEREFLAVLDAFEDAIRSGEMDNQLLGETPAGASLPRERLEPRDIV